MPHTKQHPLLEFVSGELSGSEREGVLAHLAECADCREWIEIHESLRRTLGSKASEEAGHPSSEILAEAASAPARMPLTADLARHLAGCEKCAEQLALTRQALEQARPAPERSRFLPDLSVRGWWLAAAGVVAAAGIAYFGMLDAGSGQTLRVKKEVITHDAVFETAGQIVVSSTDIKTGARVEMLGGRGVALGNGVVVGEGTELIIGSSGGLGDSDS